MTLALVDYGTGNIRSVERALGAIGADFTTIREPGGLAKATRVIVPGVGAFAEGMDRLNAGGWVEPLRRTVAARVPFLGICLGMQFLADKGGEGGGREGLGLVPGTIRHLTELGCQERIPHVGWNSVEIVRDDPLTIGIPSGTDFYFVHSFAFETTNEHSLATCDYGGRFTAIVRHGCAWGVQFHPEKSSKAGLHLLRNFLSQLLC